MFTTFAMVTNLIGTAISVGVFSHILKSMMPLLE
uniref:Uncharacterized protein n=1 Tax=Apis cerana TaxID=7461 RepID=V9IMQ4_APICE